MDGIAYGTSGHENDVSGRAPGDLELVRSFVSLHDHSPGARDSLPPSAATIEAWLHGHGLLEGSASGNDLEWAATVLGDLRDEALGAGTAETAERLSAAAARTRLSICFGCSDDGPLHTTESGVRGAVGRLVGIAFLSRLDGSWARLHACANERCRSVFWDRSKNHSGRWCSMGSCGNQSKVRAFRERERAATRSTR